MGVAEPCLPRLKTIASKLQNMHLWRSNGFAEAFLAIFFKCMASEQLRIILNSRDLSLVFIL